MVRLQLLYCSACEHGRYFQSHYGAIATLGVVVLRLICADFQSHYGAIATRVSSTNKHPVSVFQSHYGAIATSCQ